MLLSGSMGLNVQKNRSESFSQGTRQLCQTVRLHKQNIDVNYCNNNILALPQLIHLEKIKLGYKITNKLLPTKLQSLLDTDQSGYDLNKNHTYNTCKKKILNLPRISTKAYTQSFLNKGISSYSSCSDLLRSKKSY